MIKLFHTHVSEESKLLVQEVLDSGFLNQGKMVDRFERELENYVLGNVVTTNSCTSALHLAIDSCCEGYKNEVILPAQTFVATGMAVLMAGCKPVWVDIDRNTGCIDYRTIREKITDKTCAIINVHWGGNPNRLSSSCVRGVDNEPVPVIEDAAHSFGSRLGDRVVGSLTHSQARYTCFSFQSIKMLTTGDGGAICSWRHSNMEDIRRKTWFDMDKKAAFRDVEGTRMVDINKIGYKYHMNDVSAAIGLGNLLDIEERLVKRRAIAERLLDKLPDFVRPLKTDGESSYWLFTVLVEHRKNFARMMKAREIEVSVVDRRIDEYPVFANYKTFLPNTEWFDEHQISIPCHEGMSFKDVDRIIEVIKGGW